MSMERGICMDPREVWTLRHRLARIEERMAALPVPSMPFYLWLGRWEETFALIPKPVVMVDVFEDDGDEEEEFA